MTDAELIQQIKELLATFFESRDKIELWLQTKNPLFGNLDPAYLITIGKGAKVMEVVKSTLDENNAV